MLPHNDEAERAILGSLLMDSEVFDKVSSIVKASDFYNPNNQIIFSAIEELLSDGKVVDSLTLIEFLTKHGHLEKAGGRAYIAELTDYSTISSLVESYSFMVRETSRRRALYKISMRLSNDSFDESKDIDEEDERVINLIKNKKTIILLNKCDLRQNNTEMINYMSQKNKTVIEASMRSKKGVEELYSAIEKMFNVNEIEIGNETIITNIRHKNQIHKAIQSIENAINTVKQELPIDIIAVEIKEALENLGCITGDNVSEDIINEIFSKFCLGK